MKKKVSIIITAVSLVALIVVGSTLAFFTSQGTVNNVITMGNVKISLDEPMFKDLGSQDGNEFFMNDVMPGQQITKDPTITNEGDHDAYIRCKITVTGDNLNSTQIQDVINGLNINSDWHFSNGYYYYKNILPKTNTDGSNVVQFFTRFIVPETWSNELENTRFKINVTAEAIQKENFAPAADSNGNITGWNYSNGSEVPVESSSPAAPN